MTKKQLRKKQRKSMLRAIKCSESVLKYFERKYPKDKRPRKAIEAAKLWLKGKIKCEKARKAALDSHAVARRCAYFSSAQFAARAAGHTAATAHAAGHAKGAKWYSEKAIKAAKAEKRITSARRLFLA